MGLRLLFRLASRGMILYGEPGPRVAHLPDLRFHPDVHEMKSSLINTVNFNNEFSHEAYRQLG